MAGNSESQSHQSRPVVLAVDDDTATLDSFQLILERDYEVLTTATGDEALEILRSRHIDVVLLDLLMPGTDGLQVLAQIKAVDPGVEVILVSGLVQPQAIVMGMKLGAFEYLTKPFAEEDLFGLVAEAVCRRYSNSPTALFIGPDPAVIAAFGVLFTPHIAFASSAPRLRTLPDAAKRVPLLVIYDTDAPPSVSAYFIARLHERYARSKLLILSRHSDTLGGLIQAPAMVMSRPYRLDDVLECIATLAPGLSVLSVCSSRVGSHVFRLIDRVMKSYREPLGTADLARSVGCSVHHLAHIVRDQLGISLMDYVTRFRFEVAEVSSRSV